MKLEIDLPERVPVMTLPEVAFFPKVMLPLYIFEPRYRQMLRTSLEGNRMFAVTGINPRAAWIEPVKEPAHEVCTLGLIRGCKTQEDGTSHLILQGLTRIRLDKIFEDLPYREAAITPLASKSNVDETDLQELKKKLLRLIEDVAASRSEIPPDLINFMGKMEDAGDFADLVAYTFIEDPTVKQRVLESLNIEKRFDLLIEAMS